MVDALGGVDGQIAGDTLLFSTGVLDSFSLVDLIAYVEKEEGITINPTEVILDNFDSVDRIVRFVEKKRSA